MNTQPFKVLGQTLWWNCPRCRRRVHLTRVLAFRSQNLITGRDFRCSDTCQLRHCVVWPKTESGIGEAAIYSYDRSNCDKSQLPLLAQL